MSLFERPFQVSQGKENWSLQATAALAAVLILGFSLRLYGITSESIWLDEAFSIRLAKCDPLEIIRKTAGDVHPPLYYLLLHSWIDLFGESEFSVRFLSLLFGFFTLCMFYRVGAQLFNRETGIASALILAVSEFHIYYSQEARMYSLVTLLTLLSFYFFLRLESRRSTLWIGYLLSSILLIYTHVFGLFIILAQNVYLVLSKLQSKNKPRLSLKRWLLGQGALGILYGPWVPVLNAQVSRVQQSYWIETPSLMDLVRSFWDYSGSAVSCLLLCAFSFLAVVRYQELQGPLDRRDLVGSPEEERFRVHLVHIPQVSLLLAWLLTSTLLPFVISQLSRPIYLSRVTIGGSLAFFLLAARGVTNIQGRYLKLAAVVLLLLLGGANVREHYQSTTKIP